MNTRLAVELSKLDVVEAVTALKAEVDALRPLPPETEQRIMQKFRLDWNYHSNSIEGNQLNYGETVAFLMHGLTAKGKPLKDHLDIRGHNQAIEFLMSLVKEDRGISEADIRGLHKMILVEPYEVDALTPDGQTTKKWIRLGEYKRESNSVRTRTREIHYYATPEETPARMQNLMAWYGETKNNPEVHPLVLSALFHHEFTAIHPFDDGNGRMARLLSNLILMQNGYLPMVIKKDKKDEYYLALSQADARNLTTLIRYFCEILMHALTIYIKGAKGENIDEEDDIDKEIAILKASIDSKVFERTLLSKESFNEVYFNSIFPVFEEIKSKVFKFNDLFFESGYEYSLAWEVRDRVASSSNDGLTHYSLYNSEEERNIELNADHIYDEIENFKNQYDDEIKNDLPNSIGLSFYWRGFKDSESFFNISLIVSIYFTSHQYSLSLYANKDTQVTIKKFYNEFFHVGERKNIANVSAKYILNGIHLHFKKL